MRVCESALELPNHVGMKKGGDGMEMLRLDYLKDSVSDPMLWCNSARVQLVAMAVQ